jgi:hypothetical protein
MIGQKGRSPSAIGHKGLSQGKAHMKVKPEHCAYIRATLSLNYTATYLASTYAKYADMGLSAERFNWDMMHNAGLTPFLCREVYSYANDSHISTALRQIMFDLY